MLIAQISDTHMLPPGEIAYGLADTEAALRRAVEAINGAGADLVLHTGDFAHHGAPEAYALALEVLAGLKAPLYAIPGNHDDRANMRAAFAGFEWMPDQGPPDAPIQYVIDAGDLAVIALDSVLPGQAHGELSPDRLAWLESALDQTSGRPTIIALHHPPFTPGLDAFSKESLIGREALAAALEGRSHVVRMIAGHNHRSIVGMCGPVPVVVAPSASYPFAFDTRANAPLSIAFESPGVGMHLWDGEFGLLSHVLPLDDAPPPKPLLKDGKRLLPVSTPRGG